MRADVAMVLAVLIALGAGATAKPGGAQDVRDTRDGERAGAPAGKEVHGGAEARFESARGAAEGLAEEQFAAALPAVDDLREQFGRADQDGDGRINRAEWMAWFGPAYAEAMRATEGRSSGPD